MSYTVTKLVLDLQGLSPSEKAVANVLAYHAHPDGSNAFPSMTTIAREAGFKHRQSVQRVMKRLEEKKIIAADTAKLGGRSRSTRYRFLLENCNFKLHFSETATTDPQNCNFQSTKLQPLSCTKGYERSLKDSYDESYAWVFQLMEDEAAIINSLPRGLTNWVASLKPLARKADLAEKQAAQGFQAVNELLFNGAAILCSEARGSFSTLQDYEDIWALDETYGPGTAATLARKIIDFDVASHDPIHPVSVRSFAWNHLASELLSSASGKQVARG